MSSGNRADGDCRIQNNLCRAYLTLLLRPASWLALLSRTFTFELSLAGSSPRANVEYDYVGKQSIPTADFHRQVQRHHGTAVSELTPWMT